MGVTDLRPYFTQIIGHNSLNVHRIPTKLGTEIHLNEPFKCATFQPDWSTHSCCMADFAKCAKRRSRRRIRRKNEEKKTQTLAACISEITEAIFFKFGMWTPLPSRHFCSNFGFNRIRNTELKRCENRVYFLPVNILTVWCAGFLGCMTHYRVS